MIGVVLAAGRGRRMGDLTARRPKPLLLLGSEPILAHVLCGLASADVREVVVVVGYLGEQIVDFFGSGERFGVSLSYVWQETADGTAAAVLLTANRIRERPFFLSWGDVVVSRENYRALRQCFEQHPCSAWIAVNEVQDPWAGAAVYIDAEGRVQRIVEKPAPGTSTTRWNNAGLGIYQPLVLQYLAAEKPSARGEREFPQALQRMIEEGHEVRAYRIRGFWSDLGTPEALAAAQRAFEASSGNG